MRTPALIVIAVVASASLLCVRPVLATTTTDGAIVRGTSTCDHPVVLQFSPGDHSKTVEGVVARDEIGCYSFIAHAGQVFDLAMMRDLNENAAAVVFEPGWGEKKVHNLRYTDGPTLPGAGRDDAAHHIHAELPTTGRYLIMTARPLTRCASRSNRAHC